MSVYLSGHILYFYIFGFLSLHIWHRRGGNNYLRTHSFIHIIIISCLLSCSKTRGYLLQGTAWHGMARYGTGNDVVRGSRLYEAYRQCCCFSHQESERSLLAYCVRNIVEPGPYPAQGATEIVKRLADKDIPPLVEWAVFVHLGMSLLLNNLSLTFPLATCDKILVY